MSRIDPDLPVAEILRREPWALTVLVDLGFKPLANPVTRKVMSHLVTLRQACERNDRELAEVLAALAAAAPAGAAAAISEETDS
ncbi:MAG: DUF1858 domain-containing protein [Candidatus Krumholzibacteria bacterium]|jgi:hypothetical protein|nr:DUF1858 domain-containing protein [Candidatus Krumholzibacteria bacterium]